MNNFIEGNSNFVRHVQCTRLISISKKSKLLNHEGYIRVTLRSHHLVNFNVIGTTGMSSYDIGKLLVV